MSQHNQPPTFEEKWAIVVRALKRLITDAETKHLLANPEVSEAFAAHMNETPLPQLQTLSWLRGLLFRVSRYPLMGTSNAVGPISVTRRSPMDHELRIILKPHVPLNGKAVQISEGIREMCKLLRLRIIPAKDCACEDGRLKFQIKGLVGSQWAAISFGIEEENSSEHPGHRR